MIQTISSILVFYSWLLVAILALFLFLIGRFYEHQFRKRAYYQLLLLPLVLFMVGAIWYAFFAYRPSSGLPWDFVGMLGPDLLFLCGGLVLAGLCYTLYRIMMARK